jgi:hypothetical protein
MRPVYRLIHLAAIVVVGCSLWPLPAAAQMTQREFQQLPQEVQNLVLQMRASCKDLGTDPPEDLDAGIQFIDLNGDGPRDILLDSSKGRFEK